MYHRKTSDQFSYTNVRHNRVVEEYSEHEPEEDPTPSFGALRVVTVDGETVSESTRPLAKCRQTSQIILPFSKKLKRLA